ncbi:MAG TPA: hypothetical protein VI750_02545 [Pyrinomonadaceae bacterium]|nr:hypothetical protein [Pyrinomonadaceae bacterium]
MPSNSTPPGSGEIGKTLAYVGQLFDTVTTAQRDNDHAINFLRNEVGELKVLLQIHGERINGELQQAKEHFDLRTQFVLESHERIQTALGETNAMARDGLRQLRVEITDDLKQRDFDVNERILRSEKKIDSIHQADSQIATARITRTQVIAIALIGFLSTVVTAVITATVTLAAKGGP